MNATHMYADVPVFTSRLTRHRADLREPAQRLSDCRVIELPRVTDPRGNLSIVESNVHVPFDIKRIYYLYDVPGGETRGGHAHRALQQLVIAMAGSFEVVLDDGRDRQQIFLNRSYFALYIPNMMWRELVNFSSGSVCTVLASDHYDESDYFRNYHEFVAATLAG